MEGALNSVESQILVVEDEPEIRELMSLLLLRQGYRVQACSSAVEAYEQMQKNSYDLVVLDWMMPHLSGLEFLRMIARFENHCPVLMVTAKAEPQDIVEGLEAGADDYLTKPFEPNVFSARVKALLRRSRQEPLQRQAVNELKVGEIHMNLTTYTVFVAGEQVHLTPSEFKILSEMIMNQGKVLTRDSLIEKVQGEGISVTGRTIDTHVFGLRKKLGAQADWVETIRGIGYRIRSE